MFRCLTLAITCIGLQLVDPTAIGISDKLPVGLPQATVVQLIQWGLAAWTAIEANAVLNRLAENRWSWRNDNSGWSWPNEVAVVTGGSAGIGACVVKKLVSHGIKVAVLDIGPLSNQFTDGRRNVSPRGQVYLLIFF